MPSLSIYEVVREHIPSASNPHCIALNKGQRQRFLGELSVTIELIREMREEPASVKGHSATNSRIRRAMPNRNGLLGPIPTLRVVAPQIPVPDEAANELQEGAHLPVLGAPRERGAQIVPFPSQAPRPLT